MRARCSVLSMTAAALFLVACAYRPRELRRDTRLDSECPKPSGAFVYPIESKIEVQAAQSGCFAPVGAWTDERDVAAGGVRKLVYDLRVKEKATLLCCRL